MRCNFAATMLSALSLCLLSGCASIVNGTHQTMSVNTHPVYGANCKLSNDKGAWYVTNTPSSVVVNRSFQDMIIQCQKPGYALSTLRVRSQTKAMAFGNVVFGGVIGAGVDMADGAAYDYPQAITVQMRKPYH